MSRIGKLPVSFDKGVNVTLGSDNIKVKGVKGELSLSIPAEVNVVLKDGSIEVAPKNDDKKSRSLWGLTRSMINNMVIGVSNGFEKKLEMVGVGYRAAYADRRLTLFLGYSHEIIYAIPEGVEVVLEKPTVMLIKGFDKQLIGQIAAEIRSLRSPEPYKGKGIRYENEYIVRKVGKKK